MCWIVLLVLPKLSQGISNDLASLHQHATESLLDASQYTTKSLLASGRVRSSVVVRRVLRS
jgi:hypothetical protein